ncbi:ATP-binding protein [Streptomyces physcomitrii]|uniref:ATP-binding protein n=1 Tax=Streptomyces physcomitrii TaxID=2724184 RepID=A0ABX1GY10_9ACTN|nr:ATP-binding protein [Streptomyces physcomitrii]NKI40989.1 ATP-binding protein [Streptomyces physcomitrii]
MTVPTIPSPPGSVGYTRTLPCEAASARTARALVRTALTAWELPHLAEDAELAITELVANASQHTPCRSIRVAVRHTAEGRVRISVVDTSRVHPVLRQADADDAGGRGLTMIDALTHSWGTDPLPGGKCVWCELPTGTDT